MLSKRHFTTDSQRHEEQGSSLCLRAFVVQDNRGFSLIEMLVVLAITTILMGLILVPLVSTFNFTNRARRNVEVQDAARYAMELVSREVSDGMTAVVNPGDYFPFSVYVNGATMSGVTPSSSRPNKQPQREKPVPTSSRTIKGPYCSVSFLRTVR